MCVYIYIYMCMYTKLPSNFLLRLELILEESLFDTSSLFQTYPYTITKRLVICFKYCLKITILLIINILLYLKSTFI